MKHAREQRRQHTPLLASVLVCGMCCTSQVQNLDSSCVGSQWNSEQLEGKHKHVPSTERGAHSLRWPHFPFNEGFAWNSRKKATWHTKQTFPILSDSCGFPRLANHLRCKPQPLEPSLLISKLKTGSISSLRMCQKWTKNSWVRFVRHSCYSGEKECMYPCVSYKMGYGLGASVYELNALMFAFNTNIA